MKPKKLIKFSKKLSTNFKKASASLIYKELSNSELWGQIPFTDKEKIIISFLISIYLSGYDPELFYHEIENNLFMCSFEFVIEKGIEKECYLCGGSGTVECEGCSGSGDSECFDCDGEGEVWDDGYPEPCDRCHGGGEIECEYCDGVGEETCPECGEEGWVWHEDGCLMEEWVSYSWNKDLFNRFELSSLDEVVDSALFDEFWDDDKTIWTLRTSEIMMTDCSYEEGNSILINFQKI